MIATVNVNYMSKLFNNSIEEWEDDNNRLTEVERNAINTLVNEYIILLGVRERVNITNYPELLFEAEQGIEEIRLILNVFLLDEYRE